MSSRSGEMARRAAMGIGNGRNGAQVAQALQTIRYSVLDKRRPPGADTRSRLQVKRKDKAQLIWALRQEADRLEAEHKGVMERLAKLPPPERVDVSDHAVVRFLERVMGINIEAIRAQIARLVPVESLEADRVLYVRDGYQYLVSKEHLIITVLDGHMVIGVEDAFSIDGAPIAPLKPCRPAETAASQAARTLAKRASAHRAKLAETTARLKAELGMA